MFKFSFSNMTAGFIAVLVGFTSSGVIVFQAATNAGASSAEISSWLFALGMSIAITCIGLSLRYRMPILTGWSTPGAALLVTSLSGVSMSQAIGAFIFAAFLTALTGFTKLFEKITTHIPRPITSAMLAGILFHFGLNVFTAMQDQTLLIVYMLLSYLIGKRFFPRYTIILVLMVGIFTAAMQGLFHLDNFHFTLTSPIFTMPEFTTSTLISVGIPLFIVTMTSQNIPGIGIINSSGYQPPASPLIGWTGIVNMLFAPFGCFSISLAAISAAVCTSKEADSDPSNRYKATVFAGLCWLAVGLLGATVVALFFAFPKELVFAIAGLALFSTIGSTLKGALDDEVHREPAIITLLISASGFSMFGVGSAFWSLMAGLGASMMLNWHKKDAIAARTA